LESLRTRGSDILDAASSHVIRTQNLKEKAEKVVEALGLTATASAYAAHAKEEREAANIWRRVAVGCFGASFLLFVYLLVKGNVDGSTPWQQIVLKVAGSVALIAAGFYCGRESSQHRQQERLAMEKQLDLAALDPFVANLNEEQRRTVKFAAANRLFAETRTHPDDATSSADLLKLLETVITTMLKQGK
jgi:hypothetical protein